MKVERFVNSIFNSNTFILHDGLDAVIVDIGDFEPLFNYIRSMNLEVKALLLTHTHYDHIYGIQEFMNAFPGIPVYTSRFGKEALKKPNWNFSRYHQDEISIESDDIIYIESSSEIKISDNFIIKTFATPGHDKSCLCYKADNKLFTGDSYIPDVKVIASFPNSNKMEAKFWYEKLKTMADDYDIYPGHGSLRE